jgi:hypothetical protein
VFRRKNLDVAVVHGRMHACTDCVCVCVCVCVHARARAYVGGSFTQLY